MGPPKKKRSEILEGFPFKECKYPDLTVAEKIYSPMQTVSDYDIQMDTPYSMGTYISLVIGAAGLSLDFLSQVLHISSETSILLNDANKMTVRGHQRLVSHVVDPHVCQRRL